MQVQGSTLFLNLSQSLTLTQHHPCHSCHGMMQIPLKAIDDFLQWTNINTQQLLTVADFPMSSKIYGNENYEGPEGGMLVSFTTIVPGAGPSKDPYWTIVDAYKHLTEASYIMKWVHRHRRNVKDEQPEIHVIFDGSSNHTARPFDALHVGAGVCRGPGGANAPGAPLKTKEGKKNANHVGNRMNMRDGWYINKKGERVPQSMHRLKSMFDDNPTTRKKAIFNKSDGLIFKGVEEILKESEECEKLMAYDGKVMPFRCSPARRRGLQTSSNKLCTQGLKCCMHNTLKWRTDCRTPGKD